MIKAGILTISDKGARGEREDLSGDAVREGLEAAGMKVTRTAIVPDEAERIRAALIEWSDRDGVDLILTTGGTGFSRRDVTPEATASVIERPAPGIAEAIRAEGMKKTPHAILSRGVAGIRGGTLIINLPGSPKAVRESLDAVMTALIHGIEVLKGQAVECATRV